jgi:hypothetical protein
MPGRTSRKHFLDSVLVCPSRGAQERPAYHAAMSSESFAQELIQVERKGWEALCSAEAVTYYRQHLAEDALMAFPFGVMDRDEVLSAMAAAGPWASFDMETPRVIQLGPDCGVLVYAVSAQREGQETFSAVLSSTFVRRDGRWRLAFHQQSF